MTDLFEQISKSLLSETPAEKAMGLRSGAVMPCVEDMKTLMRTLRAAIFPLSCAANPDVPLIYSVLVRYTGPEKASAFVQSLPEIKRLLLTDVEAVAHNDPAVSDYSEVVNSYPAVDVMLHYRAAHRLLELGVKGIPRMLTEMAHSRTGIDIHPAARIGEYFAIDHGTGVVIGATSIIGNHVMLYQGVTLGAKNFSYGPDGHPVDEPRHPILEDNVTVYSNTSILGRVRIGHDSVIGGNVWLTHDVPPHSRVLQGEAIQQ